MGEVPATLGFRESVELQGLGNRVANAFVRNEEERPVPDDRSAQAEGAAVVGDVVLLLGGALAEVVLGRSGFIAVEVGRGPLEAVRPALQRNVNVGPRVVAQLRINTERLYPELLNGIRRR